MRVELVRGGGVKNFLNSGANEGHVVARSIVIVAAAALVDKAGRVLVQQRQPGGEMGGLWEFPGGKIEPGETPELALSRELHEELGIEASDFAPLAFASTPLTGRHLVLLLYLCRSWQGVPTPLYAADLQWVMPQQLHDLKMPPADLPLSPALLQAV